MELWELTARESIRDLIARYNANADTGRFDQVLELFAPDAVMEVAERAFEGRDAIRTIFTTTADSVVSTAQEQARPAYLRHSTSSLQIDLESPTRARSRCYYLVLMDHGLDHWGRYVDEFTSVDGRWYFAHRRVTTDGRTPGGWADARAPEANFRDG
jgi:ketosteroid isomerase-like protein